MGTCRPIRTDALPRATAAAEQYEKADERMIAVARARVLRAAGERVDAKELEFTRADESELRATLTAAAQRKRAAELVLNNVLADAMLRMEIALSLEPTPEPAKAQAAAEPADEYDLADAPAAGSQDLLRGALTALRSCAPTVESLRQNFYLLGTLGPRLRPENNSEHLVEEVLARSKHVTNDLSHLHGALRRIRYPYEHHDRNATLTLFVIPAIPHPEAVGDVYNVAERALDSIYSLYMRIMSDLAQRAEQVEADLGLPPLPEPVENEESPNG